MVDIDKSVKNARNFGMILFVVGILLAITAAAKMPIEGAKYPNTLPTFFIGFIMAFIGNFMWHKSEKKVVLAHIEHHKNDANGNPLELLKATVPAMEQLVEKAKSLEGMSLCDEVDKVLESYVYPFVEKRKTFTDILGKSKGAEVLLVYAYAERMLNRCWSAASDGHKEEALNSLSESIDSFKDAVSRLS